MIHFLFVVGYYHRFRWYATLENKTPAETFPKCPSVLRVNCSHSNLLYVMLSGCDWWISIRSVNNKQDWRKFWKRFCRCFVFQSRVSTKTVAKFISSLNLSNMTLPVSFLLIVKFWLRTLLYSTIHNSVKLNLQYNAYIYHTANITCIAFIAPCYKPTIYPTLLLRLVKKKTIEGGKMEKYNKVRGEKKPKAKQTNTGQRKEVHYFTRLLIIVLSGREAYLVIIRKKHIGSGV